jgi:PAS domain S-box-containing protein
MTARASLGRQLFRSHMSLALLGVGALSLLLLYVVSQRQDTVRLAQLRGPAVEATLQVAAGAERSQALLEHWLATGAEADRAAREQVWTEEVDPAVERLASLLKGLGEDSEGEQLESIQRSLDRLSVEQWRVEDFSTMRGRRTAEDLLVRRVRPLAASLSALLTGEGGSDALVAKIEAALLSAQLELERAAGGDSSHEWGAARRELEQISEDLSTRSSPGLHRIEAELRAFLVLSSEVLARSGDRRSDLLAQLRAERLTPALEDTRAQLQLAATWQLDRSHAEAARVTAWTNGSIGTTVVLIVLLLLQARSSSRRRAGAILEPIQDLVDATERLAHATGPSAGGPLHADLPVRSDDEIGQLTRAFNDLRARLASSHAALVGSEARNRAVVETAKDAILTIDAGGIIQSVNPAVTSMFGYSEDELLGVNVSGLMPSPHRDRHDGYLAAYLATADAKIIGIGREVVGRRKDGGLFPLHLAVSQVEVSDVTLFAGICRDLTQQKDRERDLEEARQEAEEANRAKSEFLANMSHELRTPLNAIIGFSEMLHDGFAGELDEVQTDYAGEVLRSGQHLLGLINTILDLAKIEAGKLELFLEDFDVTTLVGDVAAIAELLAKKNGNTLIVDVEPDLAAMRSDLTQVRQCLLNLLSNACKFTSEGEVRLTVRRLGTGPGSSVRFEIADNGIGMTSEQVDRVFDAFTQADASTSRQYGGTGLGLNITRRLVTLLGGQLDVESTHGVGTTFAIELPLRLGGSLPASAPKLAEVEGPVGGATRGRVLVVDDDAATRKLVAHILTQEGYSVRTAADGAEAIRLATASRPDAITLDVMLPGVDGWQVLREFKAAPDLADVPVIMLTMVGDASIGLALGATQHMRKPVQRDDLLEAIGLAVGLKPGRRALVVEDDASTRKLLRRLLEESGWTVDAAQDGAAALQAGRSTPPDVILLDLMMPVLDGLGFLDARMDIPGLRDVPVVVLTAMEMGDDEERELRARLAGLVRKGDLGRRELLRLIDRAVDEAERGDAEPEPGLDHRDA